MLIVEIETATDESRAWFRPFPIVRCPACGQRLFDGWLVGRIKCPRGRCGKLLEFIAVSKKAEYSQRK